MNKQQSIFNAHRDHFIFDKDCSPIDITAYSMDNKTLKKFWAGPYGRILKSHREERTSEFFFHMNQMIEQSELNNKQKRKSDFKRFSYIYEPGLV